MKLICPICKKDIDCDSYSAFSKHIENEARAKDEQRKVEIEARKKAEKEKKLIEEKKLSDLNEIRKYYEALKAKIRDFNNTYKNENITIDLTHSKNENITSEKPKVKVKHKNINSTLDDWYDEIVDFFGF